MTSCLRKIVSGGKHQAELVWSEIKGKMMISLACFKHFIALAVSHTCSFFFYCSLSSSTLLCSNLSAGLIPPIFGPQQYVARRKLKHDQDQCAGVSLYVLYIKYKEQFIILGNALIYFLGKRVNLEDQYLSHVCSFGQPDSSTQPLPLISVRL